MFGLAERAEITGGVVSVTVTVAEYWLTFVSASFVVNPN